MSHHDESPTGSNDAAEIQAAKDAAERSFHERLALEFQQWEQEQLVPGDILARLREYYGFSSDADGGAPSGQWLRWVIYAAVGAFLASFFTFAGSEATSLGPLVRVGVLVVGSALFMGGGVYVHGQRKVEGDALLIMGGLLLPVAFYFGVYYYELWRPASPYLWWALLSLLLAVIYGLLGRQFREEGIAGVALVAGASIPCLLAVHAGLTAPYWGLLLILLALASEGASRWPWGDARGPGWWVEAFRRPAWLLGYLLAIAASSLPLFAGSYARGWSILIYLLAAAFYVLQVQGHGNMRHLAPFLINVFAGMGATMQFFAVKPDVYPLVFLVVFAGLVGTGLMLLKDRLEALEVLLRSLLGCLFLCTAGVFFYKASHFRDASLFYATIFLYGAAGLSLYVAARQIRNHRTSLAFLATWMVWAAWSLFWQARLSLATDLEWFGIPLGLLLLVDVVWFVSQDQRDRTLTLAVVCLSLPSLYYSWSSPGLLRTLLLGLGGIGLIAWGAWREHQRVLILGVLVLLPSLFLKILPGLAELGVPRFVWFAGFGALLVVVAWLLHTRSQAASMSPNAPEPIGERDLSD